MYNSIDPSAGFRLADRSDIITAARMVFESYAPYIPLIGKIPPTVFEDFGAHISQGNLWFHTHLGEPTAMLVLTPHADHILLQSMCVLPLHQGKGIGRRLLSFADIQAKSMGYNLIKLYTNSLMKRNQRIYKRWGYQEKFRSEYDWGWRVHMEKDLLRAKKSRLKHLTNAFA